MYVYQETAILPNLPRMCVPLMQVYDGWLLIWALVGRQKATSMREEYRW